MKTIIIKIANPVFITAIRNYLKEKKKRHEELQEMARKLYKER